VVAHARADFLADLDEPLCRKYLHRFAHARAAHAVFLGEFGFAGEKVTWAVATPNDVLAERFDDAALKPAHGVPGLGCKI